MAAHITIFVPSTQLFCAGFRANGIVFETLYMLAEHADPRIRVQCWRRLEALLRDLPETLPAADIDVPIPRADLIDDLCDRHVAERLTNALHAKWTRHWNVEGLNPEIRAFMFRAVLILAETYRLSAARRCAG